MENNKIFNGAYYRHIFFKSFIPKFKDELEKQKLEYLNRYDWNELFKYCCQSEFVPKNTSFMVTTTLILRYVNDVVLKDMQNKGRKERYHVKIYDIVEDMYRQIESAWIEDFVNDTNESQIKKILIKNLASKIPSKTLADHKHLYLLEENRSVGSFFNFIWGHGLKGEDWHRCLILAKNFVPVNVFIEVTNRIFEEGKRNRLNVQI